MNFSYGYFYLPPKSLIYFVPGVIKITIYTVSKFNKISPKEAQKLYHPGESKQTTGAGIYSLGVSAEVN